MEITGKIKVINETQNVSSSFKKRELVVTSQEQYPQHILVEFHQDKVDLLDKFQVGQNVTVGINIRGREWVSPQGETKYFNTITGWRVKGDDVQATQAQPQPYNDSGDTPF
jgi:ribosomal 30S subunit maturation factor RimM